MRALLSIVAGFTVCFATVAAARSDARVAVDVEIRRSSMGIPHIQAADERSLGYGIGYAYAQDNACLLADEVVTSRGERAKFFGAEGQSSAQLNNVHSDVFFRWLNSDAAVEQFWRAQSAPVRQLVSGYVAGFNRYLRDSSQALPTHCRGMPWLQPLSDKDLVRMVRRLLVEGGLGQFAEALATTVPPTQQGPRAANIGARLRARLDNFALAHGSNAIAVGGQRTENGKGRLLANPHFPWFGALRFYQMHLTIPGRLDVMGAALPGLPLINIGFNRHLAWTHTVDASSHFTLHRLQLDARNPLRYVVDGRSRPLRKTTVSIEVKQANGQLLRQSYPMYESQFGPVIGVPGLLDWSGTQAYALQDANRANTRVLEQWRTINATHNLAELRRAIQEIQGIPWVNTLAVDDGGQALYMNVAVVPNVPPERLGACADQALLAEGLPGLDGSRSYCDWQRDAGAPQRGIVAAERMPTLQRNDYVQNSNDSAWMSNPAAPLLGYSPLVSREGEKLGHRARFALARLAQRGDRPFSESFLQQLVTDNRVYLADLILDDLLALCASLGKEHDAAGACAALSAWDRSASLSSGHAWLYFQEFGRQFVAAAREHEGLWQQPFDAGDPLQTPRGIAWRTPQVAEQVSGMLTAAARTIDALQLARDITWGQIQVAPRGETLVPIPGGDGRLGIYNAIESQPAQGRWEVFAGSSYLQLVSFDEAGPVAKGLLTVSQSSDPASPYFKDQTELFSKQDWPLLPFTQEQMQADRETQRLRLRE